MNPGTDVARGPSVPFGAELARSLVFALAWSLEVAARFGAPSLSGRLSSLVAAFGCTALTLGAVGIVVAEGRATMGAHPFRTSLPGLLVSGPVALLARVLQGKTHHRALGGVTFALITGALVVMGALVVRRLLGPSGGHARPRSVLPRAALTILVVISWGAAVGPLVRDFGSGGSVPGRWMAQDLAIGAALSVLMVVLPRARVSSRSAVLWVALWVLAVGVGAALVVSNMALRVILSEHAPVALGFVGGL